MLLIWMTREQTQPNCGELVKQVKGLLLPLSFVNRRTMNIKDEHDFLERAMKAYDNPSAITIEEFNRDLNMVLTIRKFIKKFLTTPEELNVRKLVNFVVVVHNCFGSTAIDLLLYKIKDPEYLGVLVPIIAFIGWDISSIPECTINSSIVQELIEL